MGAAALRELVLSPDLNCAEFSKLRCDFSRTFCLESTLPWIVRNPLSAALQSSQKGGPTRISGFFWVFSFLGHTSACLDMWHLRTG